MEQAENDNRAMAEATREVCGRLRRELLDEVKRLRRLSNRGLLALSLFLMLSTVAWRGFWFLPTP